MLYIVASMYYIYGMNIQTEIKTADAIVVFGSKAGLARALGISRSAITPWGENIPSLHAYRLRYEIAPDVFGDDQTNLERFRAVRDIATVS